MFKTFSEYLAERNFKEGVRGIIGVIKNSKLNPKKCVPKKKFKKTGENNEKK
jgi:hypothetical protein